jgi:cell division protein ZapE
MTPRVRYLADLRREGFLPDPDQARVVEHTQRLYENLLAAGQARGWWRRLPGLAPPPVRGLYLWGGPGRGKSYLADSFYDCLPFPEKRRVHFHRFMLSVHQQLGELPKTPNPLVIIARRLAAELRVLVLDEFHVHDIADAMLLDGLLKALFEEGITLVTTSNIEPDQLYRDGLQRERFLQAIGRLQQHLEVVRLASETDYRTRTLERGGTYQVGRQGTARDWLVGHLQALLPRRPLQQGVLTIHGRALPAQVLAEGVAWFHFDPLCRQPRSARDYLELARLFHTLLLEDVPCFGEVADEAARRFIHLVDTLYEHRVKLVLSAAAEPEELYQGRRLGELFARTASRLAEMRSRRYLALPHRGQP